MGKRVLREKKILVTMADIIIIALSAGLVVFSGFVAYTKKNTAAQVVIQGPTQRYVFPLDAEETVKVPGALGANTVVRIHGGEVWVESSPCENQTCVGMGRMNADSWWPWVACLPNNVMFTIENADEQGQSADAAAW